MEHATGLLLTSPARSIDPPHAECWESALIDAFIDYPELPAVTHFGAKRIAQLAARTRGMRAGRGSTTIAAMFDKEFTGWWVQRLVPYADVPPEKLAAEREAVEKMQQYNQHYTSFLQEAVFPVVDQLVGMLAKQRIVHRVSTWGNQLSLRVHLSWRWGELVITQSHEDAVTFEHHIITEAEARRDDQAEDHSHQYDLRDPVPTSVAQYELMFFMTRLAMDLVEPPEEPEIPPGEKPAKG